MKPKLKLSFTTFCSDILCEPISAAWAVVYKAFDGEPLTADELEIWRALSGRDVYDPRDVHELVAVKGRRSQGTKTATKFLAFKIHTGDFRSCAPKGDRLHVPIVAQSRDVSKEIMSYLSTFYQQTELRSEVAEIFKTSIELKNGFVISVQTCSYRAPRGISVPLALLDEVGVWRSEGADVDKEVVRSLTPAMIQFPSKKLVILGSPWVKAGVLFERWEHRFEGGDRLVVHAPTPLMNSLIPPEEYERERQADPQNFRREFLATWLDDIDQFLPDSDITAAIRSGVREVPPAEFRKGSYRGAIDAAGLSGKDRFTFSICHPAVRGNSGPGIALDVLRGWARVSVAQVMDEIAAICRAYGLKSIIADQFGYAFVRELLSTRGIEVRQLPWTARSKPEIYFALKFALAQGKIQLLDHAESCRELRMLEGRRTSGGSYSISAPRGSHDDYCAVIAVLAHEAKNSSNTPQSFLIVDGQVSHGEPAKPAWTDNSFYKNRRSPLSGR